MRLYSKMPAMLVLHALAEDLLADGAGFLLGDVCRAGCESRKIV
jgi:hypothetical protein